MSMDKEDKKRVKKLKQGYKKNRKLQKKLHQKMREAGKQADRKEQRAKKLCEHPPDDIERISQGSSNKRSAAKTHECKICGTKFSEQKAKELKGEMEQENDDDWGIGNEFL